MPCFAALGDQTANQLRTRFQQGLTHSLVLEHVERLIEASLGSSWTRLYDSVSGSSGTSRVFADDRRSTNTIHNLYCSLIAHDFTSPARNCMRVSSKRRCCRRRSRPRSLAKAASFTSCGQPDLRFCLANSSQPIYITRHYKKGSSSNLVLTPAHLFLRLTFITTLEDHASLHSFHFLGRRRRFNCRSRSGRDGSARRQTFRLD